MAERRPASIGNDLVEIQIPLPPLEVQKEIVAEIEGYQKVIDGARAVLDNYRPHIPIHPDWPMVQLGDVCRIIDSDGHIYPQSTNLEDCATSVDEHRMSLRR